MVGSAAEALITHWARVRKRNRNRDSDRGKGNDMHMHMPKDGAWTEHGHGQGQGQWHVTLAAVECTEHTSPSSSSAFSGDFGDLEELEDCGDPGSFLTFAPLPLPLDLPLGSALHAFGGGLGDLGVLGGAEVDSLPLGLGVPGSCFMGLATTGEAATQRTRLEGHQRLSSTLPANNPRIGHSSDLIS